MATLLTLKERVIRHFNQQDEALAGLPVPLSFTSNGLAGTIVDTKLNRASTSDTNHFDKRYVEVTTDAGSGPSVGSLAVIDDTGYTTATGTLAVSPDFASATLSGDSYLLYALGLSPTSVAQYINDTLRLTHGPHLWFPSLVPDAEFEDNDILKWADVGSGVTAAFATDASNSLFGERQLSVTTTNADTGVTSNSFAVTENENLLVFATLKEADIASTVSMTLRRITTTAADIQTASTEETAFTELFFQATVTSGTETAAIRFTAGTGGVVFRISAPVIVQRQGWGAYPAPSWLTAPKAQLVQARTWLQGRASSAADTFVALTAPIGGASSVAPSWRSDNWITPNYIMVEAHSRPTYFVVKRAYDELTSLTSTTNCNEDFVTYSAIARIYRDRGEQGSAREWGLRAAEIARAKGYGSDGAKIVENPLVVV